MRLVVAIVLMVAWVSGVLLLPGCGPSEADAAAAAEPRSLSFTVVNNTGGEIRSIALEGANLPMSFRPIARGQRSTLSNKELELPETLTLHWSDVNGDRREGTVRVWSDLGAAYSGPVTLTINSRNQVALNGG